MKSLKSKLLGITLVATMSLQVIPTQAKGLHVSSFLKNRVHSVTNLADKVTTKVANTTNRVTNKIGNKAYRIGNKVSRIGHKVQDRVVPSFVEKKYNQLAYNTDSNVSFKSPSIYSNSPYSKNSRQRVIASQSQQYGNISQSQQIQQAIGRAHRETGLPIGLISALIQKESDFNPRAVSHSGARGLTQLMPATAKWECKLDKHELFDVNKNVQCGIGYLSKQVKYFGRYDLALAAYNAGPGAVQRAIKKVNSTDIHRVTSVLKAETAPYVTKIMANMHKYKG